MTLVDLWRRPEFKIIFAGNSKMMIANSTYKIIVL